MAKKKKAKKRTAAKKVLKKKKVVRKKISKKKKPLKSKKPGKTKTLKPKEEGELIGLVTHYFPHVQAAVIILKRGSLKPGDRILIKGHTTRFEQTVESIQIDRQPIPAAKKGDEIGLQVRDRVREHDQVYKLK